MEEAQHVLHQPLPRAGTLQLHADVGFSHPHLLHGDYIKVEGVPKERMQGHKQVVDSIVLMRTSLPTVDVPEGMDSQRGKVVTVAVVTGISVTRLLAMAPLAASGPTPQHVLLLCRKAGAAIATAN